MSGFWPALREAVLELLLGRNLLGHIRAERQHREIARQYHANYMANERFLKELEKSA